jgi:hypothetical protein
MVGQQVFVGCFGTLLVCPASDGNNDWNPDRIPNLLRYFSDLAVPCPATRG